MATINLGHLRLVVYANDHPPPHTHVLGPGWEIRIELSDPPALMTIGDACNRQDIAKALLATAAHLTSLQQFWSEHHD
jgi:hypothetical protein